MSFDYLLLWALTIANSFGLILMVRQLAARPVYRTVSGPPPGLRFTDWTLKTLEGLPRSSSEMPVEYTMLFASDNCGPCHTLLGKLAQAGRTVGTLVLAADGDAAKLQQAALSARGPLYDEFLAGADQTFRQRFEVPGTPYAVAIRQGRVLASGPTRTPEDLQKIADVLRPRVVTPARP